MCILAIQYKLVPDTPILVAANRDEAFDRPSAVPSIQSGKPRVLCGVDQTAGGTWLGVNQHGLFAAACNRMKMSAPASPRSRGTLCRELLRSNSARRAVDFEVELIIRCPPQLKFDEINMPFGKKPRQAYLAFRC